MPIGSHKIETGLLLVNEDGLFLVRDEGGRWQLDGADHAQNLIGKHVRVEGIRTELGRLHVSSIKAC